MFGWFARLFGYAAAPVAREVLDEASRTARDYLDKLQEESRPVPQPYAATEHQRAQARAAAHPYPPPCPASLPPSGPPPAPSEVPPAPTTPEHEPWHQASVEFDPPPVTLTPRPVAPPRPLTRTSSGPPPRMSPPPVLPPPPAPTRPTTPAVPRPRRR